MRLSPAAEAERPCPLGSCRALVAIPACIGVVLGGLTVAPAPAAAVGTGNTIASGAPAGPADRFNSISVGLAYACGVEVDGALVCWGIAPFPQPAGSFASVSASAGHACAIRRARGPAGPVVCWGVNRLAPPGRFTQIGGAMCGIRRGGSLVCWAPGIGGDLLISSRRGRFISVSVGVESFCAVKRSGRLSCWGASSTLGPHMPGGKFLQVSAGGYPYGPDFACGLRVDRTVVCWGDDTYGQTNTPGGTFNQISAGEAFGCGVRTSGAVVCWGAAPRAPAGTFGQVASGEGFACALRTDRRAVCWGENSLGQTEVPAARFAQVSASDLVRGGCAVRIDGSLTCWGRLGNTDNAGRFLGVSVAVDGYSACALRVDRSIVCWSLNRPAHGDTTPPRGRFTQLSAGGDAACALRRRGSIVCWGRPLRKTPAGRFRQVSVGEASDSRDDFACAVRLNGFLACWGDPADSYGRTDGQTTPPGGRFTQVSAGWNGACGLRTDGAAACWGEAPTPPRDRFTQVAVGCGLRPEHVAICWIGLSVFRVRGAYSQISPSAHAGGMCAIQTDGGVACAPASLMPHGLVLPAAGPAG